MEEFFHRGGSLDAQHPQTVAVPSSSCTNLGFSGLFGICPPSAPPSFPVWKIFRKNPIFSHFLACPCCSVQLLG